MIGGIDIDFTLGDERHVDQMESGDQQFDIGPKTTALFEEKVGQFIETAGSGAVAFPAASRRFACAMC